MQNQTSLATFGVAKVNGEHFFIADSEQTIRAVVERMRDDACPIAVLLENEKILGVIDGGAVISQVAGQPGRWSEPARTIAASVPVVVLASCVETLRRHLRKPARTVVVINGSGLPIKVITQASWLRFLNSAVNTAIFQAYPHLDIAHSHAQPVAS